MLLTRSFLKTALLVLFIACVGCKGAKIKEVRTDLKADSFSKADTILVKTISADHAEFSGDKSQDTARVAEEKQLIRELLARVLVEELHKKGFTAQLAGTNKAVAGVLVDGSVTKVEHGSASARAWVGMGAGSSNMYITMRVYKGAGNLVGDFDVVATSGGSGGFLAMGSFVEAHVRDGAKKTADYFSKHIQ